jgi:hypothetical protein
VAQIGSQVRGGADGARGFAGQVPALVKAAEKEAAVARLDEFVFTWAHDAGWSAEVAGTEQT